jgi:4-hydroxybenzoate polyprenyltransferase
LLHTVSRPEFLPANSASLIIGLSWGLTLPVDVISGLIIPLALAFAAITLVAAFAAQINTLSDYELDLKDESKKELVQAMGQLGPKKVKIAIACRAIGKSSSSFSAVPTSGKNCFAAHVDGGSFLCLFIFRATP